VEDRQYNNWLEEQESKLRGCMRRKNAREKEKEEALAEIEQTIENEQREAGEKIEGYCEKIEEKENSIKKIEGELEDSQPRFEMNTALLDFIILLLILLDTIHFSLISSAHFFFSFK
jgi:ATPase subunit of ABC transporter with duplicated ATPase domains